jgi:hypothetical protein
LAVEAFLFLILLHSLNSDLTIGLDRRLRNSYIRLCRNLG